MSDNKKYEEVEQSEIKISDFWKSYKKVGWTSAVLAVVLALVTYFYFSLSYKPKYQCDTRFTITPLVGADATNGVSVYSFNYNATLAEQMSATFPSIMGLPMIADVISSDLGRPVNGTITSTATPDTNIFEVKVISDSPEDAYDVVNSLIENYPKVAEYVIGDTRMNVLEGSEPTLPTSPCNKGYYYKYVLLSAIFGVALGALIAFIRMKVRRTVVSSRDVETELNGRCLCEIPLVDKRHKSDKHPIFKANSNAVGFAESVRVLKQRARSIMNMNGSAILGITSAVSAEGKTTVAYNVAKAMSSSKDRVVLIDFDMGRRAIQEYLNRKQEVSNAGISDVAAGNAKVEDVINSVSDTFDVIFAGTDHLKFRKENYAQIFDYAKEHYDYVIVDMPASSLTSDTGAIADFCDEVLFVVKWDNASVDKILNAISFISFSDTRFMGFVLNGVPLGSGDYGGFKYYGGYGKSRYGYGYGYGKGYRRYSNVFDNDYAAGGAKRIGEKYGKKYGFPYAGTSEQPKSESHDDEN